ncbi:MAG: tetratricopeptide repeat protein [Alphaproteobacteria bacterium]|jgi:predicted O-linked N-acetylglucosamine transferase (SPINDLY family)|nr:tetratricopeptide repeat protein [Alphaproteobacteria bacterium]
MAGEQLKKARAARVGGRFEEAIAAYQAVLLEANDDLVAIAELAELLATLGRLAEAAVCLNHLLELDPNRTEAWLNLGEVRRGQDRLAEAQRCFERSLALEPENPVGHFQLAGLALAAGRLGEAVDRYERSIAAAPELAEAHFNLAVALTGLGRAGEAIAAYQAALEGAPHWAEAWRNQGALHLRQGDLEGAAKCLGQSSELQPGDAETLLGLAALEQRRGRHDEALSGVRRAAASAGDNSDLLVGIGTLLMALDRPEEAHSVALRAQLADAGEAAVQHLLGKALAGLGRLSEAAEAFAAEVAAAEDPAAAMQGIGDALSDLGCFADAESWYHQALEAGGAGTSGARVFHGLAVSRQRQQRHAEAVLLFKKALEVGDTDPAVLSAAAQSLQALGRYGEAAEMYQAILDTDPDQPAALLDIARLLLGIGRSAEAVVFLEHLLSRHEDAESAWPLLLYGRMALCDWHDFDDLVARVIELSERELAAGGAVSVAAFSLFALPVSEDLRTRVAHRTADFATRTRTADQDPNPQVGPRERLTIGYLSPDFGTHKVATALQGVLHDHDREGFRIVGYGLTPVAADDGIGDALRHGFDDFRDLSALSDTEAAALVAQDGVDILVDLAGHTHRARLGILALGPAPLQAHFLGYGKSLGGGLVDYLISDAVYWPPEERPESSESVACLPHQSLPALSPRRAEMAAGRSDFGLPDEGFVFANFHAPQKLDPHMFALWMGILERVPGSVLWLLAGEATVANQQAEAERRAIASDRLVFATRVPHAVHLARHALADLVLDTRIHGGGVTTIEALWCSVPVLSCRAPGTDRVGASLLVAAGLEELICNSLEEYLEKAVMLAGDEAALTAVRDKIAAGRQISPLFDTLKFCRHLEAAYQGMWKIALAGEAPRDFEVPA